MEDSRQGPTARWVDQWVVARLAAAGCVAPDEEAREMRAAAGDDHERLAAMVTRRQAGEPLAWITGSVWFCGLPVAVERGVYVPRPQTEILVAAALEVLPRAGVAVDLCTGSGAVAVALRAGRPGAMVRAVDIDPVACRCARSNGVDVVEGDVATTLSASTDRLGRSDLDGSVDVVTAVAPYVPSGEVEFLPRDFRDWEPRLALDGGEDGLGVLRQVVAVAAGLLRPGGALVLELGADQDALLQADLATAGFDVPPRRFYDDDGDLRAIRARFGARRRVRVDP